jgi:hypothetical protein
VDWKKGFRNIGIYLLSLTAAYGLNTLDSQSYYRKNLFKELKAQERAIGITHFSIPDVSYSYPAGSSLKQNMIMAGAYSPSQDILYLPPHPIPLRPEITLLNLPIRIFTLGNTGFNARTVLWHESGHFYVDKLGEHCDCDHSMDGPFLLGALVNEGIGEYFGRAVTREKDDFKDSEWRILQQRLPDIDHKDVYRAGNHLVKPIIDKHKAEGIRYLLEHPPKVSTLTELPDYQRKALEDLAR